MAGTFWLKQGLGCSPCDSVIPCSLLVADNTSLGQITLSTLTFDNDSTFCGEWSLTEVGAYKVKYISGAFLFSGFYHVSVELFPGDNTLYWGSTDGNFSIPSGFFPAGTVDSSLAVVETEYATHDSAMPSTFIGDGPGLTDHFQVFQNVLGGSNPDSSNTILEMFRTMKLVAPEPISLAIHNLTTFSTARFTVQYGANTTSALALDAATGTVQTALNALASITADGGVVTGVGSLSTGISVTWNVNGARSLLDPNISTVSPGWICTISRTQAGSPTQPEIQVLTVRVICPDFVQDTSLPEWDGTLIANRKVSTGLWRYDVAPNPSSPAKRQNNIQFLNASVQLGCGPVAPSAAPSVANGGAGNVDIGLHVWMVTFTSSLPQFNSESGPSPSSSPLVLVSASQVNLTSIPIGPAGTTARNIYRTRAGLTEWRLVGTISDNTTTTFTDNVDDTTIFTPAPPNSHYWVLSITAVFTGPFEIAIWNGYKLSGVDPTGDYFVAPNFFDTASGCGDTTRGVKTITLDGTF